jgi:NADH dehydrogenase [ubiquinone] 1 alpha subcomplex assembly factor 7
LRWLACGSFYGRAALPCDTPLLEEIKRRIALEGPMTVASYMALCLAHPQHGYYTNRDPLGAAGDFTTAPEISQMFGELIGLWAAEVWHAMGSPTPCHLVEMGPGRGTLMADALRAIAKIKAFAEAITISLIETSPFLTHIQQERLASSPKPITWHQGLDTLPEGPMILFGNEFLDALPIRQFQRAPHGWHEKLIGMDSDGRLVFGLSEVPTPVAIAAEDGAVIETSPAQEFFVADQLAPRLLRANGVALFIDYGSMDTSLGDTLQALHKHTKVSPLYRPGETDMTAHVPFAALAESAKRSGLGVHGIMEQRTFLMALGLGVRAQKLHDQAKDDHERAAIALAFERLTEDTTTGMGRLFKVIAFSSPQLESLPALAQFKVKTLS